MPSTKKVKKVVIFLIKKTVKINEKSEKSLKKLQDKVTRMTSVSKETETEINTLKDV